MGMGLNPPDIDNDLTHTAAPAGGTESGQLLTDETTDEGKTMGNESENDEKMKQLNIRLKEGEVSRVFAAIGMADGEVPDATAVCVFLRRQLGEVASEQALTNGGAAR